MSRIEGDILHQQSDEVTCDTGVDVEKSGCVYRSCMILVSDTPSKFDVTE